MRESGTGALTMNSAPIDLTRSDCVSDSVREAIGQHLDDFNIAAAGSYDREEFWLVGRDGGGTIVCGLLGRRDYRWLMIDWLWCGEDHRGQGLGRRMMSEAEDFALERGLLGLFVQTATFQAPGFYRRLGFVEFGRLDDLLPGHAMIWLQKRF